MIPASEAVALTQRPTQIYLEGRLPMVIEALTARQLGLHDGQVIAAKTQAQGARWWFQFQNGLQLDIPREWVGASRLLAGDTISFKAVFQADGSILLRPLPPRSSPVGPAPSTTTEEPVRQAVDSRTSQLLWRPGDLTALLNLLKPGVLETLAHRAGETPATLAQWWIHRPLMAELNSEQLRHWIHLSGWLNEALMAQGKPLPGSDTKTAIRALLQSLKQSQDSQAQWLEDALADIESSQLTNVIASGQEQVLGLVLAFADSGPVKLKFKKNGRPDDPDQSKSWIVDLELNEKELGHVWLRSRISHDNQLELLMWAEELTVADMAKTQSGRLRQLLQEANIQINAFHVYHGTKPAEDTPTQGTQVAGQLVDIRS